MSDDELLDLRFCDLQLKLQTSPLVESVRRLHLELSQRNLRFKPHCWLSTEWFSPDGVPGIAIPFYLAHPKLAALEEGQVLDVEGGNPRWCMQLLRHEAAHALDSAFRLHRKKRWRETFGSFTEPYPKFYQPRPYSKRYVLHLGLWYAQSHPAEDWAETFAVWLDPESSWRSRYQGWPALKKLEYVDELMAQIAGKTQAVRCREHVESLASLRTSLREHYERKKARYRLHHPSFYDRDLRRLFPPLTEGEKGKAAAGVLRKLRPELRKRIARWTGEYQYTIDQLLRQMIRRCEAMDVRYCRDEDETKQDALIMLTVQTMNHLHAGHHRLAR